MDYVLQVVMPENLSHQDLSENHTILFLTLSAIFLSEGQIIEGMQFPQNCFDVELNDDKIL